MVRYVLDVGQCDPDHQTLERFLLEHFEVEVQRAHGAEDALDLLKNRTFDLVLVNRKLDRDGSDGLRIIELIKADDRLARVPVMLVTNYAEHQQLAVAAGAEHGFGKLEYDQPETLQRLRNVLGEGS